MTQADAKGTAGTPGAEGIPREAGRPARNLIGLPRSPVLSHYRKQLERARVSPDDTGYNSLGFPILEHIPLIRKIPGIGPSCRLPRPLLKWLREDAKLGADKRGIVLLSHHQYYSAFENQYTLPARQLARFISRPVLWFWGHEHRLAIYGKFGMDGSVQAYGRCIGNGGFPADQPIRTN